MNQKSSTNKICDYCKTDPGLKPGSDHLWNGLLDKDTNQLVCMDCRKKHYREKSKTEFAGLYTEFPVSLKTNKGINKCQSDDQF